MYVSHMHYFRCHCGHCDIMPTIGECICCHKVEKVVSKMEDTGASSITEHEGFTWIDGCCKLITFNIGSNLGIFLINHLYTSK